MGIFFRKVRGKSGQRGGLYQFMKAETVLWVRKQETGILSVVIKSQKPMTGISSMFAPFMSEKDRLEKK